MSEGGIPRSMPRIGAATPRQLLLRAQGLVPPRLVGSGLQMRRLSRLAPSSLVEVKNGQRGPVNHLDLDPLDHRYLLAAAGDATIGLYDLDERTPPDDDPVRPHTPQCQHPLLATSAYVHG
jgi:hypothetical protein